MIGMVVQAYGVDLGIDCLTGRPPLWAVDENTSNNSCGGHDCKKADGHLPSTRFHDLHRLYWTFFPKGGGGRLL